MRNIPLCGGRIPLPEIPEAGPALPAPEHESSSALLSGPDRRGRDAPRPMSGIVLAGGASRRMGENKAELVLNGKTLLQHQVDKLRALGIGEILLSGAGCPKLPGTRVIPDEFPGQGPLAGLHACLKAARNSACLVLSVDVPLVPASALSHLCRAHRGGVTVLCRGEREEPLIAVYDRAAAAPIQAMLERGERRVRALKNVMPWNCLPYSGPEELLLNCNRPEDFEEVKRLANALGGNPQQPEGTSSKYL